MSPIYPCLNFGVHSSNLYLELPPLPPGISGVKQNHYQFGCCHKVTTEKLAAPLG